MFDHLPALCSALATNSCRLKDTLAIMWLPIVEKYLSCRLIIITYSMYISSSYTPLCACTQIEQCR